MAKTKVCKICGKIAKKGQMSYDGKLFCCQVCCKKYKKGNKKTEVCEFC